MYNQKSTKVDHIWTHTPKLTDRWIYNIDTLPLEQKPSSSKILELSYGFEKENLGSTSP